MAPGLIEPLDREAGAKVTPSPSPPGLLQFVQARSAAWRARAQALGRYVVPADPAGAVPPDPDQVAQYCWLRKVLRARGDLRILEIGAGRCWASRALAADGHRVVACDVLDDPYIGLGSTAHDDGFDRVLAPAEHLPFPGASFDIVFCFETLRHIPDLDQVLCEVARVLRPDGWFLAFSEPFRGCLTTQAQRLQDCLTHRLARTWQVGSLPSSAPAALHELRASVGYVLHESSRRLPTIRACAESVGLSCNAWPTSLGLAATSPSEPAAPARAGWDPLLALQAQEAERFGEVGSVPWLLAFCEAFQIDPDRLRSSIEAVSAEGMLDYWRLVGNMDGILIGHKHQGVGAHAHDDAISHRAIESRLLSCTRHGFLPIYGIYPSEGDPRDPYFWIQPQAGLIVPAGGTLEITVTCPSRAFRREPVRVEFRIEDDPVPHFAVVLKPGKTITCRIPVPVTGRDWPTLLLRLATNAAFIPSDYDLAHVSDNRLLSLQIRNIRLN